MLSRGVLFINIYNFKNYTMKKNNIKKTIVISIVCLTLFSGKVFSQFANWHLNTNDNSIYYNDGFVGIGLQIPKYCLHVSGNIGLEGTHLVYNSKDGIIDWGDGSNGNLYFRTLGTIGNINTFLDRMIIKNNGYVGIGTIDPGAPLVVQANDEAGKYKPLVYFIDKNKRTFQFITNNTASGYNGISQNGDFSIIWNDAAAGEEHLNAKSGFVIAPWDSKTKGIRIDAMGNVGIGNPNPHDLLDVAGNIRINDNDILFRGNADINNGLGWYGGDKAFANIDIDGPVLYGNSGGALGIVDDGSSVVLEWESGLVRIDGTLNAVEVHVKTDVWSDYVFKKDYNIMSLAQLEKYISLNKHLPDVPSEKEVKEKGVNLSEMNVVLLKKIEELTLYVIELNKKNEAQNKKIEVLEQKMNNIKN